MNKYFSANAVLSMFSKYYMELKKDLPIRPSEMGVLNIIAETPGPHTPVLLAGLLGVSKPMITAHLTDLAKKGYIEKKQSPEDKRFFYVLPTEKALALVERAKTDLNQHLERLVQEMGQDEFDHLVRLAGKASKILESEQGGEK
ncbi:MarR family winged helix-turn-helix transcriptional regulator [Hungatella effluvii]|uniref:MarR family winged helix-turn-helix transcriptional regulator n=1 Tax=Hungatella effluvii TaxID=1096246 RepID=UPI0022E4C090|nr:MarR family winged helix-turn-helix transcriptional regulator [Hungatella effluvii]